MTKLTSRKFWCSVAAFLASLGASLLGYFSDNEKIVIVGVICCAASTGIYTFSEAKVDAANVASSTTAISASTTSANVVNDLLNSNKS